MCSERKRPRCPTLRHSENEPVTKTMLSSGRTAAPTSLILVTTAWCCHYLWRMLLHTTVLKQKDNYSKCYFCLNRLILTIQVFLLRNNRIYRGTRLSLLEQAKLQYTVIYIVMCTVLQILCYSTTRVQIIKQLFISPCSAYKT